MCTNRDTINTGINIDTVKESKLKPQDILRDSESIHRKACIDTGVLFKPTSKKANTANNVVTEIALQVINCAPLTPIFLPKNPDTIEPKSGKIIIAKYII
jgi:hypothetical protein